MANKLLKVPDSVIIGLQIKEIKLLKSRLKNLMDLIESQSQLKNNNIFLKRENKKLRSRIKYLTK